MKKCFLQMLLLISLSFGGYLVHAQTVTFNTSGSWTCPSDVNSVLVECWGGGGGGGASSINGFGSGGGAGGSYSSVIITVIPGNNYTYTVGNGGNGGSGLGASTAGADSWFIDNTTVLAKGGGRGTNATAGTGGTGGAGNSAGNIGTTFFTGGNGGNGDASSSGGGGGSAGSLGAGGNANIGTPGAAGDGGGATGAAGVNSSAGIIGGIPGAGGSGAHKAPGGFGTIAGRAGGAGQVKLTYNTPTPVIFEYFKGKKISNANQLEWRVYNTESEDVIMTLENSTDGKTFTVLEQQVLNKAINGKTYTYDDYRFKTGINFYRIALYYAGKPTTYSQTVTLAAGNNYAQILLVPNPVKDKAVLKINAPYDKSVDIIISDITGKKLFSSTIHISSGENNIDIDLTTLKSGIYNVSVTGDARPFRFVKN